MLWAPVAAITSAIAAFASRLRHLRGQIGADDVDLAALLVGKFLAPGPVVDFDQFLTLLDEFLQEPKQLVLAKRGLALALRLEVGVLERGIDQPERRNATFVAGFHRALQGGVDLVAQHGYGLSRCAPVDPIESKRSSIGRAA